MTIAVLPHTVTVGKLASIHGMGVALLSAGIGDVPAEQTYLDVSQGARIPASLYDRPLPRTPIRHGAGDGVQKAPARQWAMVRERADSAPANIVPGLLGTTLGARASARSDTGAAGLMLADERGVIAGRACRSACPVVVVESADLATVRRQAAHLRGNDLLIAMERPPPASNQGLSLGIAGSGFDGTLTSDSTRMRGFVLSTDLAPTILARLGITTPADMTGEPIRTDGAADASYVQDLQDRLAQVGPRGRPSSASACWSGWRSRRSRRSHSGARVYASR